VDYVRIHQTTSYTEGEQRFRVNYRLENLTDEPLPLRAGVATRLRAGNERFGALTYLTGLPSFVGGMQAAGGVGAGLEQVAGSPWDRWDAGYYYSLFEAMSTASGLDSQLPSGDYWESGAAVQWSEATLASGEARLRRRVASSSRST
jgi:hypothetical protein